MVRRILVVNHSAVLRKIVRTKIEANINDALVLEARNGSEVLDLVRKKGAHLVLYGTENPGESASQVMESVRALTPEKPIPFLLLAMGEGEEEVREALAAGADGCLIIPCSAQEIAETINRVCNPVALRRAQRYSIADTFVQVFQKSASYEAELVNISLGGCLCQFEVGAGYLWAEPAMLSFSFDLEGSRVEVEGLHSFPVHLNVIESNPDYTPRRIRIAYSFLNPSESAVQRLNQVFSLANVE